MLLVAPAVDAEVNAAGDAFPPACLTPSLPVAVAIGYVLRHAATNTKTHISRDALYFALALSPSVVSLSMSLCVWVCVLEFALGFFGLLRAMAFAFSCALRYALILSNCC